MIFALIGLVVGIVMGLTGAGGALISIPLFLGFLDMSLKEATVLSLMAVIFGTTVNLFQHRSNINLRIALSLSIAGTLFNYLSLPLKSKIPEIFIAGILALIGIYSVLSVWTKNGHIPSGEERFIIGKALLAGGALGVITTLTGLGGGVILIPILLNFFKMTYNQALPTGLATILIISFTSFIFQLKAALSLISLTEIILLGAGAVAAYFILKMLVRNLSEKKVLDTRKLVFSLVTVYSVISVVLKAW